MRGQGPQFRTKLHKETRGGSGSGGALPGTRSLRRRGSERCRRGRAWGPRPRGGRPRRPWRGASPRNFGRRRWARLGRRRAGLGRRGCVRGWAARGRGGAAAWRAGARGVRVGGGARGRGRAATRGEDGDRVRHRAGFLDRIDYLGCVFLFW